MSVLFRVGDLVAYAQGMTYCHWCRVISMKVGDLEKTCSQVNVVTGHGVLNTKVRYGLEVLGWSIGSIWELDIKILVSGGDVGKVLFTTDTHSVHLVEWSYFLKKYGEMMVVVNSKMDFVRLNRNPIDTRDEKLNELGI